MNALAATASTDVPARISELPDVLTAEEVADLLRVHPKTLLAWAKEGSIPARALRSGKRTTWRFMKDEILEWLRSDATAATAEDSEPDAD